MTSPSRQFREKWEDLKEKSYFLCHWYVCHNWDIFRYTVTHLFNPFPHIDAFWRLCSRRRFENIVTKEEIAQNVQFLLLPQCFPLFVIGYPFNYGDFYVLTKYVQSRLLQICRMRERVKQKRMFIYLNLIIMTKQRVVWDTHRFKQNLMFIYLILIMKTTIKASLSM